MDVGKAIPMLDAVERVTGRVPYGVNLRLENQLAARVLRSPYPHARIKRLDVSAAEKAPGVVAVLTAADFERPGAPSLLIGAIIQDHPVVAKDKVRYSGEPVAVVAAEDEASAEEALRKIVVEYEELPYVIKAEDSHRPGSPTLHEKFPDNCFTHAKLRHSDVEAGFAAADEIIEETYDSPYAQITALEPHNTTALWENGRLTLWTGSQSPSLLQKMLAGMFHLEENAVRVIVPPLGGGYGGKSQFTLEPLVAVLAWKVGSRPVRLALTREEEFLTIVKHQAHMTIKTGVKRDGTITARQMTIEWGAGAYADTSPGLVRASLVRSLGPYRIPAAAVDAYGVYTNTASAGSFRGAVTSQQAWAYESHMDSIAVRLGMDPLELRLKNILREGDRFITGEQPHDIHFAECLQAAAQQIDWEHSSRQPRSEGPLRRGRGLAVMIKSTPATSISKCRLALDAAGQVTIYTSTTEMGQGTHTALAQIAASELGVPLEALSVVGPDTLSTPFDSMTTSSRSTEMMGTAVRRAADQLKEKLKQMAAYLFEHEVAELAAGDGLISVAGHPEERMPYQDVLRRNHQPSIEVEGEISTRGEMDPETGQGVGAYHYHQGAGACEVEVDIETGQVRVLRYAASAFAGQVINPSLARLQNLGNVIYGMGSALMEEMVFVDGKVINPNLDEYQVPTFLDVPGELGSDLLELEGSPVQGIGEMSLPPVAPAIANAIYDATGARIFDLPVTPEKVLKAIQDAGH